MAKRLEGGGCGDHPLPPGASPVLTHRHARPRPPRQLRSLFQPGLQRRATGPPETAQGPAHRYNRWSGHCAGRLRCPFRGADLGGRQVGKASRLQKAPGAQAPETRPIGRFGTRNTRPARSRGRLPLAQFATAPTGTTCPDSGMQRGVASRSKKRCRTILYSRLTCPLPDVRV